MQCQAIHEHFVRVGPFIDWSRPTDSFKFGDPVCEVRTVATVWNPTFDALRLAHARGAQLVVAHESIFVKGGPGSEADAALPSEREKLDWLRASGLVVYRCHDLWDRFPEIGIRASWQKGLELGGRVIADEFPLLVTEIEPRPLRALAQHVLARIRPLGQSAVAVTGELDAPVTRVATGTGVSPNPMAMWDLGADVGVMTDDYFLYVREGAHAAERGFPTLAVNHGVAEEWGIRNLSVYLEKQFPDLNVFHISQACAYVFVHD